MDMTFFEFGVYEKGPLVSIEILEIREIREMTQGKRTDNPQPALS
jgi:hypothetical protein